MKQEEKLSEKLSEFKLS